MQPIPRRPSPRPPRLGATLAAAAPPPAPEALTPAPAVPATRCSRFSPMRRPRRLRAWPPSTPLPPSSAARGRSPDRGPLGPAPVLDLGDRRWSEEDRASRAVRRRADDRSASRDGADGGRCSGDHRHPLNGVGARPLRQVGRSGHGPLPTSRISRTTCRTGDRSHAAPGFLQARRGRARRAPAGGAGRAGAARVSSCPFSSCCSRIPTREIRTTADARRSDAFRSRRSWGFWPGPMSRSACAKFFGDRGSSRRTFPRSSRTTPLIDTGDTTGLGDQEQATDDRETAVQKLAR